MKGSSAAASSVCATTFWEHLGVHNTEFETAVEEAGGFIISAIERLRSDGRSLVLFKSPELNFVEDKVLGENDLLDPERPPGRLKSLGRTFGWRPR